MESLPGELSAFADDMETIAGEAAEKEKQKALDRLYGFSRFLYNNGTSFAQTSRELANKDAAKLQKLGK